jgi:hypothetical protein
MIVVFLGMSSLDLAAGNGNICRVCGQKIDAERNSVFSLDTTEDG